MTKRKSDFTLPSYDDIFTTQEMRDDAKLEKVQNISLAELHPFKNHPFKILNNEEMERMIESIRKVGAIAPTYTVMLNPQIIKKSDMYETKEGCLSLLGNPRPCKRYKTITVQYQDLKLNNFEKTYTGFTAQIIQHEVDHINGVLI